MLECALLAGFQARGYCEVIVLLVETSARANGSRHRMKVEAHLLTEKVENRLLQTC